jgi:hypothetical protein
LPDESLVTVANIDNVSKGHSDFIRRADDGTL